MRQSESINELATAMAAAQAEMGGALKDSANPFFKSKYADLTSVVKAIKEPFANHGLSYTQFPCAADGCVGVTTRLMHNSGQWLESEYMLPTVKQDPQSAGSAITYARRYALQAMAGIPTADDDAESAMLRGSDLPNATYTPEVKARFDEYLDGGCSLQLYNLRMEVGDDVYSALHNSGKPGKKVALKDQVRAMERGAIDMLDDVVGQIKTATESGDPYAVQLMHEMAEAGEHIKKAVWRRLSPAEKESITTMMKEAA